MSNDFSVFDLDKNKLDSEWLEQSALYYEHALKLADARADYDEAKAAREVVAAETDRKIRKSPEIYGLEKVTESGVANAILLQKEHKAAVQKEIDKRRAVGIVQAMVDALDHRKKALENLVVLDSRNYWSRPQTPKDDNTRDRLEAKERQSAFGGGRKRTS